RGHTAPFINPKTGVEFPLSFSRLALLQAQTPSLLTQFVTPMLPPLVDPKIKDGVNGTFKTPQLRNVELTAPYNHNGGALTLDQVVELYNRGGNFPKENIDSLHPAISQIDFLQFSTDGADLKLIEFMKAL